ncbi:MAG: translocation/assembly module TamB domain-containing protein, partial [Enterobacterales bacterium]|nr:translocation/assembly module TamB domain-containing protein [Enterobacterales bacterium]
LGLNGQVNIPEGRFAAYGQDLLIRKGDLIFSGPPEQPLLNIEAIRNPDATEDDVTAGVRVTGLADQPKLEVFSDPAMSQQMALSYLLRGQGLESSGTDSNAMTSMLIGMGVAQSGKLVGKIGETFGVSNLSLDAQGVGDSSQVVVSGYVLPGLQVKYGVGIFDSLATLTLRYRLMPKLYLEAVSGLDQALDLLYQFEFE